eukprot:gb/GFBE01082871.1/.p1 GENE.gb/GFBE01082871.1/~~gb/GFBE01082871.1/.p1  ORF type:complete len:166 (+),score=38.76 gb/GFBE01082871.1/:1-498(+)
MASDNFDWKNSLVPVKNTFIHFQEEFLLPTTTLRRTLSGPALLGDVQLPLVKGEDCSPAEAPAAASTSGGSTTPAVSHATSGTATPDAGSLMAHRLGTCRPCGYIYFKTDGCRKGDACEFCHYCTEEDVKERKRSYKRQCRASKRADKCISRAQAKAERAAAGIA